MIELNEQQEQEMIDRAKAGDPEANYQMSLWALDQAMAEPEEERWNRLAAKSLVKAAEAGYAPAKAKMDELLQAAEAKSTAPAAPGASRPAAKRPQKTVPAAESDSSLQLDKVAEQAGVVAKKAGVAAKKAGAVAGKAAVSAGKAIASGASSLAKKTKSGLIKASEARAAAAESGSSSGGSHTSKKQSILPDFSQWDDAKWKRMQTICIVICVILAILIAILIISGNKRKANTTPEADTVQIPVAEVIETPEPSPTQAPIPEATPYPGQDIRDEIAAASLDVYPADTDYVDAPKTVTVNVSETLNLRSGPGTNYTWLGAMPTNTQLPVYANRNGWALVKYNDTWGWCSYDYLRS